MAIDTQDKSFPGSSGTSAAGSGMSAGGSSGYGGGTAGAMGSSGSSPKGQGGMNDQVQRVAQGAHQTVDKVEQTLTSGTEKLMAMQQEYGEMARERVTGNPLAALGIAFAAGIVFSEILLPSGKSHPMRRASDFEDQDRPSRTESLSRGLRQFLDLQHGPLHDVADSVSNAAHRLERKARRGSKNLAKMQHEYGDLAVEQIKAHPLLLLGVGVGVCAAVLKLFDDSH